MQDCDEVPVDGISKWHYVDMSHLGSKQLNDMISWLEAQSGGKFYWNLIQGFWFENEDDRLICVLTWK